MLGLQTVKDIFLCNNTHANENVSHTLMPVRKISVSPANDPQLISPSNPIGDIIPIWRMLSGKRPLVGSVGGRSSQKREVPTILILLERVMTSSELHLYLTSRRAGIWRGSHPHKHHESPSSSLGSRYDNSQEAGTPVSTTSVSAPHSTNIGDPFWTHRVSASFNAMADQIAAASQAIAQIPPLPDTQITQLQARMEEISDTQEKLQSELEELRQQIRAITEGPEKLQKQLDDFIAEVRLEQQRLPARLHNALVTVSKGAIKPVTDKSGKNPPSFPATRGELEHLTKERYEGLMKAYGLPIQGDLAAKRNAVRSFIGLPQV
ncbi:hypothetical protein ACEPAH_2481 [Sanghuangporus vaninii]